MFIKNWKMFENNKTKNDEIISEIKTIFHILQDENYTVYVYNLFGGQIGVHVEFPHARFHHIDKQEEGRFIHTDEMEEFDDRLRGICDENGAKILHIHDTIANRNYNIDTGYKPKITYTVMPPR